MPHPEPSHGAPDAAEPPPKRPHETAFTFRGQPPITTPLFTDMTAGAQVSPQLAAYAQEDIISLGHALAHLCDLSPEEVEPNWSKLKYQDCKRALKDLEADPALRTTAPTWRTFPPPLIKTLAWIQHYCAPNPQEPKDSPPGRREAWATVRATTAALEARGLHRAHRALQY